MGLSRRHPTGYHGKSRCDVKIQCRLDVWSILTRKYGPGMDSLALGDWARLFILFAPHGNLTSRGGVTATYTCKDASYSKFALLSTIGVLCILWSFREISTLRVRYVESS